MRFLTTSTSYSISNEFSTEDDNNNNIPYEIFNTQGENKHVLSTSSVFVLSDEELSETNSNNNIGENTVNNENCCLVPDADYDSDPELTEEINANAAKNQSINSTANLPVVAVGKPNEKDSKKTKMQITVSGTNTVSVDSDKNSVGEVASTSNETINMDTFSIKTSSTVSANTKNNQDLSRECSSVDNEEDTQVHVDVKKKPILRVKVASDEKVTADDSDIAKHEGKVIELENESLKTHTSSSGSSDKKEKVNDSDDKKATGSDSDDKKATAHASEKAPDSDSNDKKAKVNDSKKAPSDINDKNAKVNDSKKAPSDSNDKKAKVNDSKKAPSDINDKKAKVNDSEKAPDSDSNDKKAKVNDTEKATDNDSDDKKATVHASEKAPDSDISDKKPTDNVSEKVADIDSDNKKAIDNDNDDKKATDNDSDDKKATVHDNDDKKANDNDNDDKKATDNDNDDKKATGNDSDDKKIFDKTVVDDDDEKKAIVVDSLDDEGEAFDESEDESEESTVKDSENERKVKRSSGKEEDAESLESDKKDSQIQSDTDGDEVPTIIPHKDGTVEITDHDGKTIVKPIFNDDGHATFASTAEDKNLDKEKTTKKKKNKEKKVEETTNFKDENSLEFEYDTAEVNSKEKTTKKVEEATNLVQTEYETDDKNTSKDVSTIANNDQSSLANDSAVHKSHDSAVSSASTAHSSSAAILTSTLYNAMLNFVKLNRDTNFSRAENCKMRESLNGSIDQSHTSVQYYKVKDPIFYDGYKTCFELHSEKQFIVYLHNDTLVSIMENTALIRSIALKNKTVVEIPRRILNRPTCFNARMKYIIIIMRAPNDSCIRSTDNQLRKKLSWFNQRKKYDPVKCKATLFLDESVPDNATLCFNAQRTGAILSRFGHFDLKNMSSKNRNEYSDDEALMMRDYCLKDQPSFRNYMCSNLYYDYRGRPTSKAASKNVQFSTDQCEFKQSSIHVNTKRNSDKYSKLNTVSITNK